jgi:hypothetical protein
MLWFRISDLVVYDSPTVMKVCPVSLCVFVRRFTQDVEHFRQTFALRSEVIQEQVAYMKQPSTYDSYLSDNLNYSGPGLKTQSIRNSGTVFVLMSLETFRPLNSTHDSCAEVQSDSSNLWRAQGISSRHSSSKITPARMFVFLTPSSS